MKINTFFIALALISSCRTLEEPTDLGYDFYPLEQGDYWVYSIDSTAYDEFSNEQITSSYHVKEEVVQEDIDNEGQSQFIIDHFYSTDSMRSWTYYKRSIRKKNQNAVEQQIHSVRVVLLIFPINDYKYWDMNQYNNSHQNKVQFRNNNTAYETDHMIFDNTVSVVHQEENNSIFKKDGLEVYAKAVGLVYQEHLNTETQNGNTKGYTFTKTLIESNHL